MPVMTYDPNLKIDFTLYSQYINMWGETKSTQPSLLQVNFSQICKKRCSIKLVTLEVFMHHPTEKITNDEKHPHF